MYALCAFCLWPSHKPGFVPHYLFVTASPTLSSWPTLSHSDPVISCFFQNGVNRVPEYIISWVLFPSRLAVACSMHVMCIRGHFCSLSMHVPQNGCLACLAIHQLEERLCCPCGRQFRTKQGNKYLHTRFCLCVSFAHSQKSRKRVEDWVERIWFTWKETPAILKGPLEGGIGRDDVGHGLDDWWLCIYPKIIMVCTWGSKLLRNYYIDSLGGP